MCGTNAPTNTYEHAILLGGHNEPKVSSALIGAPLAPVSGTLGMAIGGGAGFYTGWQGWELVYRHRTGILDASHTGR